MKWTYILIAHGTIAALEELPAFLLEIRRGRPVPEELLQEMQDRYERIGQSPLLEHTYAQAAALEKASGYPCRVAMRLSNPRLLDVVGDLGGDDGICLIPIAPFSVGVYASAAQRELDKLPRERRPLMVSVEPWGAHPSLIEAYVDGIQRQITDRFGSTNPESVRVILTAHSLPNVVIRGGDRYSELFEETVRLVTEKLSVPVSFCYQSQGASGNDWLGPTLSETLETCSSEGVACAVVAPIGFLAEHIETLYDLDIEAKAEAERLDLELLRVPTLCSDPGLIAALAHCAEQAIASVPGPKEL